jgi:predicted dehydrogenase
MNRREFLGASGAGLVAAGVASATPRVPVGPNDTLHIGIVGPGGRGTSLIKECIESGKQQNARLTAVCDIWSLRRDAAATLVKEAHGTAPKVYRRFEEMLADKNIDAIIIATPDHAHGKLLIQAVEAGKDVYCEKPMANVLAEANQALDAVQRTKRIVQIGTQRRAYSQYREAARLMREGVVGDIVKVDCVFNDYSPYRWAAKPEEIAKVKESDTDWKTWLLGKPDRPFDPRIYRSFRLFKDFSSGIIDQWMTHLIDAVHMLTGEPYPRTAVALGGIYHFHDYRENPDTIQVLLEYGTGGKKFLTTYATCLSNASGTSCQVQGKQGTLEFEKNFCVTGEGVKSADAFKGTREISGAPATIEHMTNWLDCVRRRDSKGLFAGPEAGYGHSVACIMSNDAYWTGRRMQFDPVKRTILPA